MLLPLVVLALFMGVASPRFTRTIEPTIAALLQRVQHGERRARHRRRPAPGAAEAAPR